LIFFIEKSGGGFEGDIILPPSRSYTTRGVGFNNKISRWPNRVIPYDLSAITSEYFVYLLV